MKENKFIKNFVSLLVNLLNILFIGLTLFLLFVSIFKQERFVAFIEWLKVVIEGFGFWNYFIIFFSSFIEAFPVLGVVVPGQNILIVVGGFFGNISQTNLIYVAIIACLGAIFGNFVGYFLGKKYGDSFFEKYGNRFGIGLTEVKYLKKSIHKWGAIGIIFGKFHPMTRAFLPFIAGSMGMKQKNFMLYNMIGSVIWSTTMVLLGMVFVEYYEVALKYIGYIFTTIILLALAYLYIFKKEALKTYMIEKSEELDNFLEKK